MKQEIAINEAQKLTSPNPFALLSVEKEDGGVNLMAISWWMYTSNNPASMAVCLSNKGFSGGMIKEKRTFALSVVSGEELKEAAFLCGTCSGRDHDKAGEFSIELEKDSDTGVSYVKEARVNFILNLVDSVTRGDHTVYFAEVSKIFGDSEKPGLFAMNGYSKLDTVE